MVDSKRKRGKPDRIRAARTEDYEVDYIAKKLGVSRLRVRNAIRRVGNDRKKVYSELRRA